MKRQTKIYQRLQTLHQSLHLSVVKLLSKWVDSRPHRVLSLSPFLSLLCLSLTVSQQLRGKVLVVGVMTDNKSPFSAVCVGLTCIWLSLSHLCVFFSTRPWHKTFTHSNMFLKFHQHIGCGMHETQKPQKNKLFSSKGSKNKLRFIRLIFSSPSSSLIIEKILVLAVIKQLAPRSWHAWGLPPTLPVSWLDLLPPLLSVGVFIFVFLFSFNTQFAVN